MKYTRVYMDSIAYELPPIVVTSSELEERLVSLYRELHFPEGQLEELTGIFERRWWDEGFNVSQGAVAAAKKALKKSSVKPEDLDILLYTGVSRENFEPATACHVAAALEINPDATVYDISNACLGVLNGIVEVANRIELGQIRAGMVVSCETAREINESAINQMLEKRSMKYFISSLATLTGGSGAVAVIITDGSFSENPRRKLLGGAASTAPQFYELCRWGMEKLGNHKFIQAAYTDSVCILKNGVKLGLRTWNNFLKTIGWTADQVNKVICHQVGESHRNTILNALEIPLDKDFITFPFLGNIGTVSLPITAAIAEERDFLKPGDNVGFLGIGSGLNCLMLGWIW